MEHHHPWRELRDEYPDWDVVFVDLPSGRLADTDYDRRVIRMDIGQMQDQRRCSLAHELIHVRRGDRHGCDKRVEEWIERQVARQLVPFENLLKAAAWARTPAELADELWIDVDLLAVRIAMLHPAERAAINRVVQDARGH